MAATGAEQATMISMGTVSPRDKNNKWIYSMCHVKGIKHNFTA